MIFYLIIYIINFFWNLIFSEDFSLSGDLICANNVKITPRGLQDLQLKDD